MFTSIVVGVDRSEHAKVALSQAVDIARTQKATLTVLVAYSTLMPWGPCRKAPSTSSSPTSMRTHRRPRPGNAVDGVTRHEGSNPSPSAFPI
jgi:nucleotide-binding universal stress UspA family protein